MSVPNQPLAKRSELSPSQVCYLRAQQLCMTCAQEHVTDFAHDLEGCFLREPGSTSSIDDLVAEAQKHVNTLRNYYQKPSLVASAKELNESGTHIWNLCNRLRRETTDEAATTSLKKLYLVGRVFAFHLLAVAQRSDIYKAPDAIRLMRLALKIGSSCIGMWFIPI